MGELLLLAADTPIDKFAWMEALTNALLDSPCPTSRVTTILSMLSLDRTQRHVLQSQVDDFKLMYPTSAHAQHSLRGEDGAHRLADESIADTSTDVRHSNSPGFGRLLDKMMPSVFKNL